MNEYKVITTVQSRISDEFGIQTRDMTNEEIIKFLENKLSKLEKKFNILRQYLDEDHIEAINEIEDLLNNNAVRKECFI